MHLALTSLGKLRPLHRKVGSSEDLEWVGNKNGRSLAMSSWRGGGSKRSELGKG
jgi:hypothetical protein